MEHSWHTCIHLICSKCKLQPAFRGIDAKCCTCSVIVLSFPALTPLHALQEFIVKLVNSLAQFPPPQPTQPAVDLLVTVGQQQEYFSWHNLLPPAGHPGALDALKVCRTCSTCSHMPQACFIRPSRMGCHELLAARIPDHM